ncbi:hypothetical protein Ae201684P_002077 [Aphanomyces euteiches]|nr:hypothetical protein Ae201684P_002077 [Aphanomyces euteiches]
MKPNFETPRRMDGDDSFLTDASFVMMEPSRVHTAVSERQSLGRLSAVNSIGGAGRSHRSSQQSFLSEIHHKTKMHAATTAATTAGGFKRSVARGDSLLLDAPFLEDEDANQLILNANRAPMEEGASLEETMQIMKAREYYREQFAKIQEQAGMNPHTLRFSPVYERAYTAYAQKSSLLRVRFIFLLGLFSLGFYLWYDTTRDSYKATASMPFWQFSFGNVTRKNVLDALSVVGPLSFAVGAALTNLRYFHGGSPLEMLTFVVFGIVSLSLIVRKPVGRYTGPVLPLVILLIPVFGITKMRFQWSCLFGWSTFVLYLVIQLTSKHYLDAQTSEKWDSVSDLVYQTINYGISIIGGMVSHYRQELLRRRNFALQLPFSGLMEDDSVVLDDDKFKKRNLLRKVNMGFKDVAVENVFYKHWYLIDSFPFQNPNEASLHAGVFRVLRFPIYGLLVDQIILGIQDYKLLWLPGHPVKPKSSFTQAESSWAYYASVICRYGITVPCYLSLVGVLYCMGNAFYRKWLKETNQDELEEEHVIHVAEASAAHEAPPRPGQRLIHVVETALNVKRWRQWRDERWTYLFNSKGGYVRYGQIYASVVVVLHVSCIATLLLWVTRTTHKKQNVYFMGFINALLFPHRSGFRIRFIYATVTTVVLAVVFMIVAAFVLAPSNESPLAFVMSGEKELRNLWIEYMTYVVVVILLGMFISREEESLRRSFFILKSLRTLEFEEWFHTLLKIQGWMRAKLQKKLEVIRARRSDLHPPAGSRQRHIAVHGNGLQVWHLRPVVQLHRPSMPANKQEDVYARQLREKNLRHLEEKAKIRDAQEAKFWRNQL